MGMLIQGILGFLVYTPLLFLLHESWGWNMSTNIKTDLPNLVKMIDSLDFMYFHSFIKKIEITSQNETDVQFIMTEEISLISDFFKQKIISKGTMQKNKNSYIMEVHLNVFEIFPVLFHADLIIAQNNDDLIFIENTRITGPILPSYVVKYLALPCHENIMKKLKEKLDK